MSCCCSPHRGCPRDAGLSLCRSERDPGSPHSISVGIAARKLFETSAMWRALLPDLASRQKETVSRLHAAALALHNTYRLNQILSSATCAVYQGELLWHVAEKHGRCPIWKAVA